MMARLNAPLRADGVSMVVIYGRMMQRLYIYLLTYIKTNTVPLGRCGLGRIDSVHKCGVSNGTVN